MASDKLIDGIRSIFGDKVANLWVEIFQSVGFRESLKQGMDDYNSGAGVVLASNHRPGEVPTEILNAIHPVDPQKALDELQPTIITTEDIARRAYEISQSPECGSDHENWVRAEKELTGH